MVLKTSTSVAGSSAWDDTRTIVFRFTADTSSVARFTKRSLRLEKYQAPHQPSVRACSVVWRESSSSPSHRGRHRESSKRLWRSGRRGKVLHADLPQRWNESAQGILQNQPRKTPP